MLAHISFCQSCPSAFLTQPKTVGCELSLVMNTAFFQFCDPLSAVASPMQGSEAVVESGPELSDG
jgi:hypothetical protein